MCIYLVSATNVDFKCSSQEPLVCLSTAGITPSWKVVEYPCMPSPSRNQKMIPGTVATSGRSSLLKTCMPRLNHLLHPDQLFFLIHRNSSQFNACLYTGKEIWSACTCFNWPLVKGSVLHQERSSMRFGVCTVLAVEAALLFSCNLCVSFLPLRAWSTARNVTVRS